MTDGVFIIWHFLETKGFCSFEFIISSGFSGPHFTELWSS